MTTGLAFRAQEQAPQLDLLMVYKYTLHFDTGGQTSIQLVAHSHPALPEDRYHFCEYREGYPQRYLEFSNADRRENIRRLGELARQTVVSGRLALVAAISPLSTARDEIQECFPAGRFIAVFVDAPLRVCDFRDPKGLYRKARQGLIRQFIRATPATENTCGTDHHTATQCVETVIDFIRRNGERG